MDATSWHQQNGANAAARLSMNGGESRRLSARQVLLGALAAALYSGCYALIKAGLSSAPPLRFAALRAAIGGLLLLVVLIATRRPPMPPRRLWTTTLVLGLLGPTLGFMAMFLSPGHTGVALASVLGNVGPLVVIVLAAVFLREPVTSGTLAALFVGMSGVLLIVWPGRASTGHAWAVLFPLVASLSGASESVIAKRARRGADVLAVTAWQFLVAVVPVTLLSGWLEAGRSIAWTASFAMSLGILAGAATAGATALWYSLVQEAEVSRLSMVLFLVPVMGLFLGTVAFDERVVMRQAVGIAAVLLAVALTAAIRSEPPPSPRPASL